jgi:hypothetical protein
LIWQRKECRGYPAGVTPKETMATKYPWLLSKKFQSFLMYVVIPGFLLVSVVSVYQLIKTQRQIESFEKENRDYDRREARLAPLEAEQSALLKELMAAGKKQPIDYARTRELQARLSQIVQEQKKIVAEEARLVADSKTTK